MGAEIDKNDNTLIEFGTNAKKIDLQSSLIDYYEPEIYTDAACTKQLGDDELLERYKLNDVVKLYKKPIEYTIAFDANGGSSIDPMTYTIESETIDLSTIKPEKRRLSFREMD